MPHSRGGGSFGGGGGHSHGGGSSHGGRGGRNTFSKKPFAGSRRYYYYNRVGVRCAFYYSGVPTRAKIGPIIGSAIFFVLFGILFLTLALYSTIPRKLKPSKCEFYPEYVHDESSLLDDSEEATLRTALEKFYNETGIQPFVYAVAYDDIPEEYTPVKRSRLERYSEELYLDFFNDEGHMLILLALDTNSTTNEGIWVCMAGYDTDDLLSEEKYKIFQKDLTNKLAVTENHHALAIAEAFEGNIDTFMTLSKDQKRLVAAVTIFMVFFMAVPILGTVRSIKQSKEINEYCDYREKHGGKDFIDSDNSPSSDAETGGVSGSDLFD